MIKKTIWEALRRGLGIAIIALGSTEDKTKYRNKLLHYCLQDISYDWQSEGPKGYYLYDALLASGEPEYYKKAIMKRFLSSCSDGLAYQLSSILYCFAADGDEEAKETLLFKYNYFASKKRHLRNTSSMREGLQWSDVAFHLMHIDGFSSFKRYVVDVGRYFFRHHDSNDRYIYDEWFQFRSKNIFGEKRINTFLINSYQQSNFVKSLVDILKIRDDTDKALKMARDKERITVADLLSVAREAAGMEHPLHSMRRIGRAFLSKVTGLEISNLIHTILIEEDLEIKATLLSVLALKGQLSLDLLPFDKYARSENTNLAKTAIDCMKNIKDDSLHELAIQLLAQKGLNSFALSLFVNNYKKADDSIISSLIKKSTSIPHHVQHDIGRIYCRHRSENAFPILFKVYRKGDCAFCRYYIVRAMHHCRVLSTKILKECIYDSYDETRDFARRLLRDRFH